MLSRRKIEVIVAILILILLAVLLFLFLRKPKVEEQTPDDTLEPASNIVPEVNPAEVPAAGAVSASVVARTFVERFGSYSSESDFANVDDVMRLATPRYQTELESLVVDYRRNFDAEAGYTGISTVVIGMDMLTESETNTSFLVTTQRQESVGSPGNTTVRYQDVEVSLVKSGDDWLIDALTWK